MNAKSPLLEIEDLHVDFHGRTRITHAVRGLSLSMGREKIGIVGESGSGKSVTGRAILGLIRPPGVVRARKLTFDGVDILSADERALRAIRGARASMIMQDPKYSLNPVMRVGDQIAEAYVMHRRVTRREARQRALQMLEAVKIRGPERVYRAYPHELSGGMGQRVMIAMMLIPEPDSPTSP